MSRHDDRPADRIELTDAEYDVLFSAIAYYESVLEDDNPRRVPTLNRAADKILAARRPTRKRDAR